MRKHILNIFLKLSKLFKAHGFTLYMVGGTSRDYILSRDTTDLDLATDAKVEEMLPFLNPLYETKTPFKKYGNVKFKTNDAFVDITTLREESNYQDSRHPNTITFVKGPENDAKRRDFTVNALYIDDSLTNIHDYYGGLEDLLKNRIKMIGDPNVRLEEDPLRILRALRFSLKLNFTLDEELAIAIKSKVELIKKLNPEKVKEEILKMYEINEISAKKLLSDYNIPTVMVE